MMLTKRSNNFHKLSVGTQNAVIRQQDHWLESRLRHQEPIERVLVNGWEFFDLRCMFAHDGQVIETGRLYAGQNFIWVRFEFAQRGLDADLPDRGRAREYFARVDSLSRSLREFFRSGEGPQQQVGIEQ